MTRRIRAVIPATALLVAFAAAQSQPPPSEPDGEALFVRYCASCHGRLGEGDGPVAAAIQVSVPNLRTLASRAGGSFPRDSVIRFIDGRDLPDAHGDRLMPVWGETFSVDAEDPASRADLARRRITAIADYIAELQR